jgi:hypothetical protein
MTAQSAINLAETSNINLFITSTGNIRYEGDQHSVEQLLPLIKKHKAEIIQLLREPKDNHNPSARKSRDKLSSSFTIAHEWISQHRFELRAAGWTNPEFYRRNKSRGIAWMKIWGRPGLDVIFGRSGEIVFRFKNTAGKSVQQTAFPRRHYGKKQS